MTLYRLFAITSILLAFLLPTATFGQSNFIPLDPGDLTEQPDPWGLSQGLQFGGVYQFRMSQMDSDNTPSVDVYGRDVKESFFEHDLRLRFKTTMHRHISLNLELATGATPLSEANLRENRSEARQMTPSSQVGAIQARQAFLEYNSNPHAITRLGKQMVYLGDGRGKVFSGILTGVTHKCRAGTWCYEVGALKAGNHAADWMYYAALDYDLFEYQDSEGNITNKLNVEVFRIMYSERDIPLGKNNGPLARNVDEEGDIAAAFAAGESDSLAFLRNQAQQVFDQEGSPIYYDAFRQEYFGLRLHWETTRWSLYTDLTANQGRRRYHLARNDEGRIEKPVLGDQSDEFRSRRKREATSGVAMDTEIQFRIPHHRFWLNLLQASGDKERRNLLDDGENYLRTLYGYYEIVPGSYRLTNFYFSGNNNQPDGGSGLGRSINNTMLVGFRYQFSAKEVPFSYQVGLFHLQRHRSVLNEEGKRVMTIGQEFDNTFVWIVDKHLHLNFQLNLFNAGEAFSFADNIRPVKNPEQVIHGAFQVRYAF